MAERSAGTVSAFRIVPASRSDVAFTGLGSSRVAGRWHSIGTPVVYTADSRALAALEVLGHVIAEAPVERLLFECHIPRDLIYEPKENDLPQDWFMEPPLEPSRRFGDAWVHSERSAVLCLPTIHVPVEKNYLLNPQHPDFPRIRVLPARPFRFHKRLIDRKQPHK